MRAEGARHLAMLWQHEERRWEWWALKYGHAQPQRFVLGPGRWRRRYFRFHLTPLHLERWAGTLEIGLCFGWRTIYLMRHR
jgi:hypothetical protein